MSSSSSFALSPAGQVFPRFAFRALTNDQVAVTHHHLDGEILRKRTDRFSTERASQFIVALRGLGYTDCPGLG